MHTSETNSNRLLAYGSLACGATALIAGNAEAATIVNVDASSYNTGLSNFGTISSSNIDDKGYLTMSGSGASIPNSAFFKRGTDTTTVTFATSSGLSFQFSNYMSARNGAALYSDNNWFYAVGKNDSSQRMWLQLEFGGEVNFGFSIVKAVIPTFAGELPTAAAAAAVPETSSLALLSLGAAGLLQRRRRAA